MFDNIQHFQKRERRSKMNATHPFLFSSRRLKFAQRQFVAATLAGMCFAHGAIACDAETLIAFEGQWAGQGQVITESNTNEPIACRLVFQRSPEGPLITNGKCATLAQTLPVTGYLQCQGGALIGPLLKLQGGPDPEFVEDASQGDHIQLVLKGPASRDRAHQCDISCLPCSTGLSK